MLLSELKQHYQNTLTDLYPPEEVDSLFYWIAEHYLQCTRMELRMQMYKNTADAAEKKISDALLRLQKGEPVQYIVGETEFLDLTLKVAPGVLIPRPETEFLVHTILQEVPKNKALQIVDLCTGSGCIAIALAANLPKANVSALEISTDALQIAKENARLNTTTLNFVQDDILQPVFNPGSLDLIVSNPPYVRMQEKELMHKNVLEYEPESALFVEDDNPLIFYEAIANFGLKYLVEDGLIYLEINEYLGKEMKSLYEEKGFRNVKIMNDLDGKTRFLKATC